MAAPETRLPAPEGWLREVLQASRSHRKPSKATQLMAGMLLARQAMPENKGGRARWARRPYMGSLVVDKTRGSNLAPSCQEDRLLQRPDVAWAHRRPEETMAGSLRIVT